MIRWLRDERAALAAVLVAGLAIRLVALQAKGYPSDPTEVTRWAEGVRDYGLFNFYAHIQGGYYPAVLFLLWPLSAVLSGDALHLAVKGLAIPFDLLTGAALYLFTWRSAGARAGVIAAALYVLNPASVVGGAYWGQLDVIGALCMLGAATALGARRWGTAGLLTVVGGMVKAIFGVIVVVVAAAAIVELWRSRRAWRPAARAIAGGLAGYAIVGLPLRLSPFDYLGLVSEGALRFPYASLNALNVWGLTVGFFSPDAGYTQIGVVLLLGGLTAALVPLWWRRDAAAILAVCGAVVLAFFFLPTRVHDRYLFPAIVLFAPLAAARPRLRLPYVLLSVAFAVNLAYTLWNGPYEHALLPLGLDHVLFAQLGMIAVGLVLSGSAARLLWLLARGECSLALGTAARTSGRGALGRRGVAAGRRLVDLVRPVPPLVLLVVVFLAVSLWPELRPIPMLNDNAYHLQLVERAANAVARGEHPFDHWLPDLELGFPVFFYYQQLPYLAVVLLGRISFGLVDVRTLFDVVRYLLLVGLPLTAFAALRWMGWSRTAAAAAAVAAALFSGDHRFGLEYDSYLWRGYGLYTQIWAVHLSLIALAALYRLFTRGAGGIAPAVVATATLVLAHLVYGYMMAITAIVLALVGITRATARTRLARLFAVGALVAAISAYLLPAYLGGQPYLDVSPFLPRFRFDSFGAPTILGWLVSGELFDHGRPPVLTALAALGIGVALVRRERLPLVALALFCTWLALYFGRVTYGPLADLLPFATGLPVHRFIGAVQLAAALLVGVAAEWLFATITVRLPRRGVAITAGLALVILAPVLAERWSYANVNREWIEETDASVSRDRDARLILQTLDFLPPGRVYAGLKTNWGKQLAFSTTFNGVHFFDLIVARGFDPVRPASFSFSLNSDLIFDFNDARLADYQVFNARYVVAPAALHLPAALRPITTTGNYILYAAPSTGYATYVALSGRERPASQAELLTRNRLWLASDDPGAGRYIRMDFPAPIDTPAPADGCAAPTYEREVILPARLSVTVSCPQAATLAFKVTFHPDWRVSVDGIARPTFMVSPSYLAVALPPGRHVVVAEYQAAPSRTPLLLFGALVLGATVVFRRRLERLVG